MIVKELDEVQSSDKFIQAGVAAEKQMAFYLKRGFGDNPDVLVLNSLRIEKGDDSAQMDHLILHEFGMVIIESKSVTTEVSINEHGEWSRLFDGAYKGMPSPVLQAKRQGEFLKNYLKPHTEVLLKKLLGVQLKFDKMPIDVIVAISDTGIINRPSKPFKELDSVCKADRAVEKINQIIKGYRKKDSALSVSLGPYLLGKTARKNTSQFLLKKHTPIATLSTKTAPKKKSVPSVTSNKFAACNKCHGTAVEVLYGKYGYYLKCSDCQQNTALKVVCPCCKKNLRVRKEKEKFFLECRDCNTSVIFHKNVKIS